MNRYIEQLIEDFRKAAISAPHLSDCNEDIPEDEALENHFDEVERYVQGGHDEPLSSILGIPSGILPKPEKLNPALLKKLLNEMIALLNSWNFYPDFPEKLPDKMKYRALLDIWDDEQTYMRSGQMHIEFCDYNPDNCPFPGYCDFCDGYGTDSDTINDNRDFDDDDDDDDDWIDPEAMISDVAERFKETYDAPDNDFIPGIYNYCDRWCERCDFTDRCANFHLANNLLDEMQESDSPLQDEEPDVQDTMEDTDEASFFQPDDDQDNTDDFFSIHKKSERHPLAILSEKYAWTTYDWLNKHHQAFEKNLTYWLAKGQADELNEGFKVLSYYNFFIHMKLTRAISGYYELQDFDDAEYDMNGSAKVALIGIDRMLEAIKLLRRYMKTERGQLEGFRKQLEKMRFETEELFPEARSFVRPGLDEDGLF
jgi:hypothetical protein